MNSSNGVTAETIDSIIRQAYETYVYDLITTSAFALICYATVLNIGYELEHIWLKRFSLPTLLYVFTRYGSIIDEGINLAVNFALESLQICNILADAGNSMSFITSLGVQGLLIARAYSLSGGNKILAGVLGFSIFSSSTVFLFVIIKFNGCSNTGGDGTEISILTLIRNFSSIFIDLVVFFVCMWKLWGVFKLKRESGIQNSGDLVSTLVKQSILRCCFVIVALVTCTIIESAASLSNPDTPFPVVLTSIFYYQNSLSAILVADFTLDLRRQNATAVDHATLPTLQFRSMLQHVHQSFIVELGTPEDTDTDIGTEEGATSEGSFSEFDGDNGIEPSQTRLTADV